MVRPAPVTALPEQERRRLAALELSYPRAAGFPASTEHVPTGYWAYSVTAPIGRGESDFRRAVEQTMTWQIHRLSGIAVAASDATAASEPATVLRITIPVAFLRFTAFARIVGVLAEPRRGGWGYGTLPGHPESGEEWFVVEYHEDDVVTLTVSAFSRPAAWYARLGGPITRALQRRMARRFLRVLAA